MGDVATLVFKQELNIIGYFILNTGLKGAQILFFELMVTIRSLNSHNQDALLDIESFDP